MNKGKAIWKIRRASKLSQMAFCEKTGITQGYLSKVEKGDVIPKDDMLDRIGQAFGINGAIITMYALEDSDVPENKRAAFLLIKDSIRGLIEEIVDGHANS